MSMSYHDRRRCSSPGPSPIRQTIHKLVLLAPSFDLFIPLLAKFLKGYYSFHLKCCDEGLSVFTWQEILCVPQSPIVSNYLQTSYDSALF